MKHVFLVAAHNNPEYLVRMVNMLDAINHYFVIHIDKKNDSLLHHPALEELNSRVNCIVYSEICVNWGGYSQVSATLSLIRKAKEKLSADYYHLISGCDLPLKTPSEFDKEVEGRWKGFMGLVDLSSSSKKGIVDRYRVFHFNDFADRRNHGIKTIICRIIEYVEILFSKCNIYFRSDINLQLWKGSNWWSLDKDIVDYILSYLENNPNFEKRFQWTSCIDEVFFHLIVFNSPFEHCIERNSHRYVDWKQRGKNENLPRVLSDDDICLVEKSMDCWFARKTDPVVSRNLIDYFEKKLNR